MWGEIFLDENARSKELRKVAWWACLGLIKWEQNEQITFEKFLGKGAKEFYSERAGGLIDSQTRGEAGQVRNWVVGIFVHQFDQV